MKTGVRLSLIGLLAILMATSCAQPTQVATVPKGTLVLDLGGSVSGRAVFPFDPALASIDHYHILLTGPDGATETIEGVTSTLMERSDLAAGVWTVNVIAYNKSDKVLGRGMASGEVTATRTTRLSIIVSPSGEGTLKVGVTWEGNSLVTEDMKVETSILPVGQDAYVPAIMTNIEKGATYEAKLGSGNYNVLLKLKDSQDRVRWGYVETFHLYEDLDTTKTYTIPASEMNAAPEKAPVFLKAERGHDRVMLYWDVGSARGEKFILERKTADTEWVSLTGGAYYPTGIPYTMTSWTDYGLAESTTYLYRIRSENYLGTSAWSEVLQVVTMSLVKVGARMSSDTVWTADKVYQVTSNLLVQDGITLRVQPGTKVMINSGVYIQVEGELIARGQPDAPIIFGFGSSGWSYINFIDKSVDAQLVNGQYQSGSALQYVMIRGGGRIGIERARPYLDHLDIAEVSSGNSITAALDGDTAEGLRIENSRFGTNYSGTWAIHISNDGRLAVENNEIFGGYGVYIGSGRHQGAVSRNIINTGYDGISIGEQYSEIGKEFDISDNMITWGQPGTYPSGNGILLNWGNHQNVMIRGNDISRKEYGINFEVHAISGISIKNNKISSCRYGGRFNVYYANSSPAVVFEGNSIIDSLGTGQFFNFYQNHLTMWQASGNYYDNPSAEWEVQLGDWMRKSGDTVLNLSNNYWGTNTADEIAKRIRDSGSNFEYGKVAIEPISVLTGLKVSATIPADSMVEGDSAIDFSWLTMGRAISYHLQIAKDSGFNSILIDKSGITDSSWTLGQEAIIAGMKNGVTYYWRVSGKTAGGTSSAWTSVKSFKIDLAIPLPTSPLDGETLYEDFSPRLAWQASTGAHSYRLVLDDDSAFTSPIVDTSITGMSEYELSTDLAPGKTYHWKVSARDINGFESNQSAVQAFVVPPAGIVVMVNPNLPGPQNLSMTGPDTIVWGQYPTFSVTSESPMDRYVWTFNGEKVAETYVPSFSFSASSYQQGFYTIGVTAWKNGYPYSTFKTLKVSRDGAGVP